MNSVLHVCLLQMKQDSEAIQELGGIIWQQQMYHISDKRWEIKWVWLEEDPKNVCRNEEKQMIGVDKAVEYKQEGPPEWGTGYIV